MQAEKLIAINKFYRASLQLFCNKLVYSTPMDPFATKALRASGSKVWFYEAWVRVEYNHYYFIF